MIHNTPELSSGAGFMPHGMCYLWQPGILALHVSADSLITLAYFSIPFTLLYFVRKRCDLEFNWMFVCFAVFIVACGATHLLEIWVIWHPDYWVSGTVKAITALASVPTAVLLVKLMPTALKLPRPADLQEAYAVLEAEVIGQSAAILFPPTRRAEEVVILARIGRGERIESFETALIRKDGTQIDVSATLSPIRDEQGAIVGASKIARDITERRRGELKLAAQLARLHLLNDITRAIGERQDLASIFQVVIGTLEEQLPIDFGCVCLYDSTSAELTVVAVGGTQLAGELALSKQSRIPIGQNGLARCVSGQVVYEPDLQAVAFPFPQRLAAGGLRAMVAAPLLVESRVFGVLITARRETGSFSSGECEFLRQLSEHVALAAHQAQLHGALQTAYEDLRQTQQTVARMKEFYAQRDPQRTRRPVDLNRAVKQVIDLTRARWSAMPQESGVVIRVETDLAVDLPPISGDESDIRDALTNLVLNAVDAMPDGGCLTIRSSAADPQQVEVAVTDTGVGMDEATRSRCLELFFTTKGARGTGLGLAMVYGMAERHGGEIRVDSEAGRGTTVRLLFPRTAAASLEVEAVAPAPRPAQHLRILIVDDDAIILKSLRSTLELDGHHITVADGGRKGIDAFRAATECGRPFSAVITDLGMPHVDGRAVAAAVKATQPDVPVILLTGWGVRLLAENHTPAHVDRVLGKPPKLATLRAALYELTASTAS